MSRDRPLRGACACGRNQYAIIVPPDATERPEVYFDYSSEHRRTQAAPLTAWLRVPLAWFQSHTRSFFPDESHTSIRRTFTPFHAPHSKRNFCGFCGTPLTYWTEKPPEEAEYMSVTIGSLFGEDQSVLEDLGLLPNDVDIENSLDSVGTALTSTTTPSSFLLGSDQPRFSVRRRSGTVGGIPWFEEMIEGSRLGRVAKSRRGVGVSTDGSMKIEWDVSEWHSDWVKDRDSESESWKVSGKRKSSDI